MQGVLAMPLAPPLPTLEPHPAREAGMQVKVYVGTAMASECVHPPIRLLIPMGNFTVDTAT